MTQDRWNRLVEWPLAIVAVIFLVAFSWEVLADLHGMPLEIAEWVIDATWLIFVVDYVVNLILASDRWRWFYTHLFDLAIVVLPILRPLRLLRLVTLLAILNRTVGLAFRGRVLIYAAGAAALLVYVAALAMLDTERPAGGSIQTFPEALWWAFVSITTVGYGDYVPITGTGQLIAVGVMLGGIALIGMVTASLASWIVERVATKDEKSQAATRREIEELSMDSRSWWPPSTASPRVVHPRANPE